MLRIAIAVMLLIGALPAQATEAGWALLRNGGHVVLLRNAMTTGTVEPPNFDIEKCATQLNLSDRGRQQARKIGALFAALHTGRQRGLWIWTLFALIAGLLFGGLVLLAGNLLPAVIAHFVVNAVNLSRLARRSEATPAT